MKNTRGYIYRGDGKLTVINVPFKKFTSEIPLALADGMNGEM